MFTGSIGAAHCVQAGVDSVGNAEYIYEEVHHLLTEADLTVGTLNAAISDYPRPTGCVQTFVLVGSSIHADAMADAGFDVMSVATNHIKNCGLTNCGDRAFLDTLENLRRAGIVPIGSGNTLAEALRPVVIPIKCVRFAFISLGELEPLAFAGENIPGIAVLDEENLRTAVSAARELGNVVVFFPHWGPEYVPNPNPSQLHLARVAADAGVDLVFGNYTHVIQVMEAIDSVPIFYGLGNFVFDQTQLRETQQGAILQITFYGVDSTLKCNFAGYGER